MIQLTANNPSTATTIARTSAITASAFCPSQLVKRVMVGWHPVLDRRRRRSRDVRERARERHGRRRHRNHRAWTAEKPRR